MEYVVYCDESRHEASTEHPYMAIGSLWLPRDQKDDLTKQFKLLCRNEGLRGEVKWNRVSKKYLTAYKHLVDFFFNQESIRYRVIVVEHSKIDVEKYHGGDRELGFYKFYYLLLKQWFENNDEYLVLLDFKKNKGSHRYSSLRRHLERSVQGKAWISDLTVIDSSETPLAQLCDLLTGAVAAAWCHDLVSGRPKSELAQHIGERRGGGSLHLANFNAQPSKFNIFNISLK
ncbi:MAG TPA: DUF3800 domain-containing protein [Nitrospiraceae bacterium]|nr:DUF3800 domain-containing protein [Nitrospiraceae bacterium]